MNNNLSDSMIATLFGEAPYSAETVLLAWGAGIATVIVMWLFVFVIGFLIARSGRLKPQTFRVVFGYDSSYIRLNKATLDDLKLRSGGRIVIARVLGQGRTERRGKREIENLGFRQDGGPLRRDQIEISKRTLDSLFSDDIKEDDPIKVDLRNYELRGFSEYLNDPDDRVRFANRFTIFLTIIVLAIELGFGFFS